MDHPQLWGLKLGAYVDAAWPWACMLIHYFHGTEGGTVLRPAFGIGVWKAKLCYAYNLSLAGHPLPGINTHQLSLSYAWRVRRLRGDDDHRARRQP